MTSGSDGWGWASWPREGEQACVRPLRRCWWCCWSASHSSAMTRSESEHAPVTGEKGSGYWTIWTLYLAAWGIWWWLVSFSMLRVTAMFTSSVDGGMLWWVSRGEWSGSSPLGVQGQKKGEGWALCSASLCFLTSSYEPGVQGEVSTHTNTHRHRRVVRVTLCKHTFILKPVNKIYTAHSTLHSISPTSSGITGSDDRLMADTGWGSSIVSSSSLSV